MSNTFVWGQRQYTDQDQSLWSSSASQADSLTAESLEADTMTVVVNDDLGDNRILATQGLPIACQGQIIAAPLMEGSPAQYTYGQPVTYLQNGALLLKQYIESVKQIGAKRWQFNCISGIGLLLTSYHYGGIYTGQTAATVIADIIGGIIPYTLNETLGQTVLYGWLPKAFRRDNLRSVLFSIGAVVGKDQNGDLIINPSTAPNPYEIPVTQIYMGGSVAGLTPATAVVVAEHTFLALETDETITLYDGEAAGETLTTPQGQTVEGVLVEFQEPMHNLQAQNTTILESGANYAVLSNSGGATLTGQVYSHTQRLITRGQNNSGPPNVVRSTECCLVNSLNSENVAQRLVAYYSASKNVEADIVVTTQKPGDAVTFVDPFGAQTQGYIAQLDLVMSAITKGRAVLADGFIPTASGNNYTNIIVITQSGNWVSPITGYARVTLISGGDGGQGGTGGNGGGPGDATPFGSPGTGGEPGQPGQGGKIYSFTTAVTQGQSYPVGIGEGGAGGAGGQGGAGAVGGSTPGEPSEGLPGAPGESGGATTFAGYSSNSGGPSNSGYSPLLSNEVYALPGPEGIAGGAAQNSDLTRPTITDGTTTWTAGDHGANASNTLPGVTPYTYYGGGGGGPAVGANGPDGNNASSPDGKSGDGANGATALQSADVGNYGAGGAAGNGGGGGGGGGGGTGDVIAGYPGAGGTGGDGSPGGNGAQGVCIIVY